MIYSTSITTRRQMRARGFTPRSTRLDRDGIRIARHWYRNLRIMRVSAMYARWAIADLLEAGLVHGQCETAENEQHHDQADNETTREPVVAETRGTGEGFHDEQRICVACREPLTDPVEAHTPSGNVMHVACAARAYRERWLGNYTITAGA